MRVFKSKTFERFARSSKLIDRILCKAVEELSNGAVHASLGGGVFKQRIARAGEGKSGGFRTIIFFRAAHKAFFILGFAKNSQGNLAIDEVRELKILAKEMLHYDDSKILLSLNNGTLIEINCEEPLS